MSEADKEAADAAQKEAEKKGRQRKAEEFREQCYLVSKMIPLAIDNNKAGTKYKNFTTIVGNDTSPNVNINQLFWYKDQQLVMSLTPAQLAILTPKIRLFVVTYAGSPGPRTEKTEKEIEFQGTSYDLETLLADPASRGKNLGLKSFSWQFNGTDPWTATNLLQADMTVWGDSLGVFEKGGEYDSLLLLPQPGKFIEIKAVVGWSVPSRPTDLLSKKEIKAINDQSMTLLLSLTQHEFDFQQDGSFNLTLKYKGRIDIAMNGIDLLGPLNEEERRTDYALSGVQSKLKGAKAAAKSGPMLDMARKQEVNPDAPVPGEDMAADAQAFLQERDEEDREVAANLSSGDVKLEKQILSVMQKGDVSAEELTYDLINQKIIKARGLDRMNRIIRTIENLVPTGPDGTRNKSEATRIYNVLVSAEDLDSYFDKYGGMMTTDNDKRDQDTKNAEALSAEREKQEKERKKAIEEQGMSPEDALITFPDPPASPEPPKAPSTTPPPKSTGFDHRTFKLKKVVERMHPGSGKLYISFFYLGDLLEAILGICKFQLDRARINFIIGSMKFKDPFSGKSRLVNLTDIPISLRRFAAWFHKRYNKDRPTTTIPLKGFLQAMMTELIRPALTSECFRGSDTIGRDINRIGGITVTTHEDIPKGRVSIDQLMGNKKGKGSEPKGAFHSPQGASEVPLYNNFLFTSMMDPSPPVSGDRLEDSKLGIMHYYLGRDSGLLKKASFSRNNLPGLTEHRMTKEVGAPIDRMREKYNVDLEMLGNTFMRPGTMFHITPTVPGMGALEVAERIGIGGYYVTQGVDCTITPGSFLLNVKAIHNNMSNKATKANISTSQKADNTENLSDD